ncbi:MAG: DUF397 domain-containing protein [Candidatus Binatia bacterium]
MNWKRSSFCKTDDPMCVEVAIGDAGTVVVRDSKNIGVAPLVVPHQSWHNFLCSFVHSQ